LGPFTESSRVAVSDPLGALHPDSYTGERVRPATWGGLVESSRSDRVASVEWGRKLARLPSRGVLLAATDLHGNRRDYERLKELYRIEHEAGNRPLLLLCGDLVHGPSPDLTEPGGWPTYLGTPYRDESAELVLDYLDFASRAHTLCLLGNHEHAHVGGPRLGKFYPDEAAVLEATLGLRAEAVRAFMATFPLVAAAPCGAVFTHAAPAGTEPDSAAFEALRYEGFEHVHLSRMALTGTVGALLWSRMARPEEARLLLRAVLGRASGFVAYGHDVVRDGYEKVEAEQICFSTSYGLFDADKVYLRLKLDRSYESVGDLVDGAEIRPLYP
jgi:hypothetical protein